MVTFEETKKLVFEEATNSLTRIADFTDQSLHLIPYMVWREINMGPARRVVFMRACEVTDMLIGEAGTVIYVPIS